MRRFILNDVSFYPAVAGMAFALIWALSIGLQAGALVDEAREARVSLEREGISAVCVRAQELPAQEYPPDIVAIPYGQKA